MKEKSLIKGLESQKGTDGIKDGSTPEPTMERVGNSRRGFRRPSLRVSTIDGKVRPTNKPAPKGLSNEDKSSDFPIIDTPKSYMKYVRDHLSLYEIGKLLYDLPSPRKRFFFRLSAISGMVPTSVQQILCRTASGRHPGTETQLQISKALNVPAHILFPENRLACNSLVDIYWRLPNTKCEFEELISDIRKLTFVSRRTVVDWIKGRCPPKAPKSMADISSLLGVSISNLFPQKGT